MLQKGKGKGKNKSKTARLWVYARDETPWASGAPPAAWHQFSTARGAKHPSKHLETYAGLPMQMPMQIPMQAIMAPTAQGASKRWLALS
ncbi:MAG: transposase, partial [Paracoccaceae bacterium]